MDDWLVIARAVHFLGCFVYLGNAAMDRLIVVPGAIPIWRPIAKPLGIAAAIMIVLSGIAWFFLLARDMADGPLTARVCELVWQHTHFGRLWQARLWICIAAFAFDFLALISGRFRAEFIWLLLTAAILLTASLAMAGHGQTGRAPQWHLASDIVHLLAAAFWVGGLPTFFWLLRRMRYLRSDENGTIITATIRRFSNLGLVCVLLIALTGVANTACLLGSFADFVNTSFGRVLLVKTGLFLAMLLIAAVNRVVLLPKIDRVSSRSALRKSVAVEMLLGFGVILVVAILGLLPPAP